MAPTKKDQDPDETRLALIEAAETLFGERGVDAVSLRQIGSYIKSSNTNVIGYHFGTKQDLIEAIYEYRLPEIERRRRQLMSEADSRGCGEDIATLLYALWLPIFEQKNRSGRRSFARFVASMTKSHWIETRRSLMPIYSVTTELMWRLWKASGSPQSDKFETRLELISMLIASSIELSEAKASPRGPHESKESIFFEAIEIAVNAIAQPRIT